MLIKLMNRNVPVVLLKVLINYDKCAVLCLLECVIEMFLFDVWCETRGVLSPLLFSVYVEDMIQKLCDQSLGCYVGVLTVVVVAYGCKTRVS